MADVPSDLDAPTLVGESAPTAQHVASASNNIAFPCQFGRYELLEEIARGGMGIVFRARQLDLQRDVAVKMIIDSMFADPGDIARFLAEAEAAAHLDHPGIVPIYEVGEFEGRHFFSMALIEGESLAQRIADGPLNVERAATLVAELSDAIDYAHKNGIIHRDLKPGNVLLNPCGRPRVTDFGVAKRKASNSELTMQGEPLGTPSYMPPEQAAGDNSAVDVTADVYSLGAILYASLTGRPPFHSANQFDTLHQVINDEVTPPRRLNSSIPSELETITLKCLEKQPSCRYSSAGEVAADLRRYLAGEPIKARPPSAICVCGQWVKQHLLVASMSGVTTLALVAGMIGLAWKARSMMDRHSSLTAEVNELRENEKELRIVKQRWTHTESHRISLLAEKEAKRDFALALLLSVDACERLGGVEPNLTSPAMLTMAKLLQSMGYEVNGKTPKELCEIAKSIAGRELTNEERSRFFPY